MHGCHVHGRGRCNNHGGGHFIQWCH